MTAIVLVFILLFANHVRVSYKRFSVPDPWSMGDWLNHYGAGFTRRGLSGEVILRVAGVTGISPSMLVVAVQLLCYAALLTAALLLMRRTSMPHWFLWLVFSPATFLFTAASDGAGKKDVFILATLAWFMIACQQPRLVSTRLLPVASMAAGAVITLTHEMAFFYIPYFIGAAWLIHDRQTHALRSAWCVAGGATVALAAIVVFGRDIPADALCGRLVAEGVDADTCYGTVIDGVVGTAAVVQEFNYPIVYGAAVILASMPALIYFARHEMPFPIPARTSLLFLLAALTFSVPMFVGAYDWGRYLNVHFSSLALLCALALARHDGARGPTVAARAPSLLWVAALVLYSLSWSMPICCRSALSPGLAQLVLTRLQAASF